MHLAFLLVFTQAIVNAAESHIRHEKLAFSHDQNLGDRLHPDSIIPLRIALRQQNLENAESLLLSIADPLSPQYGKYWTRGTADNYFAPAEHTISVVTQWLVKSGIPDEDVRLTANRAWIAVDLSLSHAERLLRARYHETHNQEDDTYRLRCSEYFLPTDLVDHIDYVTPGVIQSVPFKKLLTPKKRSKRYNQTKVKYPWKATLKRSIYKDRQPDNLNCSEIITPDCVRALYGIPRGHLNDSVNAFGIFEAQIYFSQADLDDYYSRYASYISNGSAPEVIVVDDAITPPLPQDTTRGLVESTIDLDMALSLIYPQTVTYYQVSPNYNGTNITGGNGFIQASLNFLDAIDGAYCTSEEIVAGNDCGTVSPARVISISYDTPEINSTVAWQIRQCKEFMKLSLQGHTIIAASGDFGVGSVPPIVRSNGCIDASTRSLSAGNGTVFSPGYPQNCPYVLSVGGTQLKDNVSISDPEPETAMQLPGHAQRIGYNNSYYSSSGGFSNVFARPKWQQNHLDHYFAFHDPGYLYYKVNLSLSRDDTIKMEIGANHGLYNRLGRASPDVSAIGANFATVVAGNFTLEYGTSLAAPLWGALLTLINEERHAAGKGPVGFVQPVLYRYANTLFRDIVSGSNPGCGTAGFKAVNEWDPVTGLGTPVYESLLQVFMSLP